MNEKQTSKVKTSNTTMTDSPWHDGERQLHARMGIEDRMEQVGRQVIRTFMPDGHRTFYRQLPFIVVGTVDKSGRPWVSVLEGQPGFISSPDSQTLSIMQMPQVLDIKAQASQTKDSLGQEIPIYDPLYQGLNPGDAVGLLGIEFHSRRRNRMNGFIKSSGNDSLNITVQHAFGNCPQYIQTREYYFDKSNSKASSDVAIQAIDVNTELSDAAKNMIENADTFFVASYVDDNKQTQQRNVDVSHRGGKMGFVRIDGNVLTIPDFAGNLHFNTLGNLLVNAKAGLLFIDFNNGDVLQVSGTTEIVFESEEIKTFQGAERLWRFTVENSVLRRSVLGLRWHMNEFSSTADKICDQ